MKKNLCPTPPMGWNSWDCYGASVTEAEVRANAEYMAENLREFGWNYIIVDIQWYEPTACSNIYNDHAELVMDEYSRLMPAENRFPSAKDGAGFKPLADYVHSLGLKFGIHILRGIPRQAVYRGTKILGSSRTASEIANLGSICPWNTDMVGVDCSKEGAQEYYNSLFELYASWGVDFVKVDDIARPYHKSEVETIAKAIENCGRDIVLSLSPGAAPVNEAAHLAEHANMWRMSDDFWDSWRLLREMFDFCRSWYPHIKPEHYPDCDMLPLGKIALRSLGEPRMTNFTPDEQLTMMSLWCIFGSPLFFGGDMTYNDDWTLSLMRNCDLLEMHAKRTAAREVYRRNNEIIWAANGENCVYLAQFNVGEEETVIRTELAYITQKTPTAKLDIWSGVKSKVDPVAIESTVKPHGVMLWRIDLA